MKSARIPVLLTALVSAVLLCLGSSPADVRAGRPEQSQQPSSVRNQIPAIKASKSLWKGSIVRENGVEIVRNPATPIYADARLELQTEYVIGPSASNYQFIKPTGLLLGANNELFVMDIRDHNIKVFDEQGRWIRTIGRMGQGPGELIGPSSMSLLGNELGVYCGQTRRLTYYDSKGNLSGSIQATSDMSSLKIDSHGSVFAFVNTYDRNRRRTIELRKFDPQLRFVKTVAAHDWIPPQLQAAGHHLEIDRQDRIIYGYPYERYEFSVFDNSGRLLKKILKDGGPLKIPSREMAFIKEHYQPFPGTTWKDVSEYYPFFCGTDLDDRGWLIVRTHVFLSESRDFFDVFSPDGQYLANVSMKHTLWRLWANGRLYAIEDDPEGLPVIKIYRVAWSFEQQG